jgi:hypothetical protein
MQYKTLSQTDKHISCHGFECCGCMQALHSSTPKMQPTTLPTNGGGKIIIMPYEEKK